MNDVSQIFRMAGHVRVMVACADDLRIAIQANHAPTALRSSRSKRLLSEHKARSCFLKYVLQTLRWICGIQRSVRCARFQYSENGNQGLGRSFQTDGYAIFSMNA